MRHTISILVENKFGVLTRVAGLFSGRGYNIDTLNVAPTQDPTASRMTIVTRGDDATLEQIIKQLNKLPESLEVTDFRANELHADLLAFRSCRISGRPLQTLEQSTDWHTSQLHQFLAELTNES